MEKVLYEGEVVVSRGEVTIARARLPLTDSVEWGDGDKEYFIDPRRVRFSATAYGGAGSLSVEAQLKAFGGNRVPSVRVTVVGFGTASGILDDHCVSVGRSV